MMEYSNCVSDFLAIWSKIIQVIEKQLLDGSAIVKYDNAYQNAEGYDIKVDGNNIARVIRRSVPGIKDRYVIYVWKDNVSRSLDSPSLQFLYILCAYVDTHKTDAIHKCEDLPALIAEIPQDMRNM